MMANHEVTRHEMGYQTRRILAQVLSPLKVN